MSSTAGLGDLLFGRLDLLERDDIDAGRRREFDVFFLFLHRHPRARRALEHGPALRADDRILVEVEELGAAVLTLAFGSEFGFGHGDQFPVVQERFFGALRLVGSLRLSMRFPRRSTGVAPMLRARRRDGRRKCENASPRVSVPLSPPFQATPRCARSRGRPLQGRSRPPGDKSISHRAFIFGLLTCGETRSRACSRATTFCAPARPARRSAPRSNASRPADGGSAGPGLGALVAPRATLDFGNAGTGSRLMMGVVGGHGITATFDGDASLRKRPMRRILDPLRLMGAEVLSQGEGGRCPIVLRGRARSGADLYRTPVASAQIKSAVLLAGLNARGVTTVDRNAKPRATIPRRCWRISAPR